MVVYQMLLQLAINMVFHYDGSSMTNAQASPRYFSYFYCHKNHYYYDTIYIITVIDVIIIVILV